MIIHNIWQGGDIFPAVIIRDDGVWMEYVQLDARDVRGARVHNPAPRTAPSANNRGLSRRQDEAYKRMYAATLQHVANLMEHTK